LLSSRLIRYEAIQIAGLLVQLFHHPAELGVQGFGHLRHQTGEPEGFAFGCGEAGALVEAGIMEEFHSALVDVGHG
jgi:hypothetical protein